MKKITSALAGMLCFSVAGLMALPSSAQTPNASASTGINLTGLSYWSTQWTLIDVMKQASNGSGQLWATSNMDSWVFNTGHQAQLDLDENGWPRSLPDRSSSDFHYVSTIIFQDNEHYPIGDYTVLYDGEGELNYGGVTLISSSAGRDVVRLDEGRYFHLQIRSTDPENNGNYLRNIRIIAPGGHCGDALSFAQQANDCAESDQFAAFASMATPPVFHPLFLQDIAPFRTLRFMRFLNTINNPVQEWSESARPEHGSWALNAGAPVAVAAEMANEVQAEPWLNLPVRVSDDYARQAAMTVKETLDDHLTLYLEYGNELWNSAYPYILDGMYAEEQGKQLWPDAGVSDFEYRLNYYGMRSAQICAIWKDVFSDSPERVQCVMGGMGANSWVNNQSLSCPLYAVSQGRSCAADMSALAIAPYFAGYMADDRYLHILSEISVVNQQSQDGLEKLFDEFYRGLFRELTEDPNLEEWQQAPANGALAQAREYIEENKALADEYGLQLVAYEGGQHLTYAGNMQGNREEINEHVFLAANRDPRMGQAFKDHLTDWHEAGGAVYVLFESTGRYGRYGAFPLKEYQLQPESETPKMTAVLEYMQQPCLWNGCERITHSQDDNQGSASPDDGINDDSSTSDSDPSSDGAGADDNNDTPDSDSSEDSQGSDDSGAAGDTGADDTAGDSGSGQDNEPLFLMVSPIYDTQGAVLSWQGGPSDVAYYEIYLDRVRVGHVKNGYEYTLNWLELNRHYGFRVIARDNQDQILDESGLVISTAGDSEAPSRPEGLVAESDGEYGFNLSWQAATDNHQVGWYKIYRNGVLYTMTAAAEFHDPWPPQGPVSYAIVAKDVSGNLSEISDEIQVRSE